MLRSWLLGAGLIGVTLGTPALTDPEVPTQPQALPAFGPPAPPFVPRHPIAIVGGDVIDAHGMTVMPGLIDSNEALQLNPLYPSSAAELPIAELRARWEANFRKMAQRAYVYLMQGVTSQRQTSGPRARLLPIKRARRCTTTSPISSSSSRRISMPSRDPISRIGSSISRTRSSAARTISPTPRSRR
jgi:hypothetical protein